MQRSNAGLILRGSRHFLLCFKTENYELKARARQQGHALCPTGDLVSSSFLPRGDRMFAYLAFTAAANLIWIYLWRPSKCWKFKPSEREGGMIRLDESASFLLEGDEFCQREISDDTFD